MSPLFRSFAKINLYLQVVGRRADGFHELRTVFQTVADHDLIRVELGGGGVELSIAEGEVEAGEGNLALRAARAYLERWAPGTGAHLELFKRLPIGAGLGGGSSNAATVLMALADLAGVPADRDELWEVARELGADVPYFLVGGTALGVGRGDEITPLPELEEATVWLVTPPIGISTRAVFAALGQKYEAEERLAPRDLAGGLEVPTIAAFGGHNDLAPVVFAQYPGVASVYNALLAAGAESVGLSGSGSSVFAHFAEEEATSSWIDRLPAGSRVVRTTTLSRAKLRALRTVEERGTTKDGDH